MVVCIRCSRLKQRCSNADKDTNSKCERCIKRNVQCEPKPKTIHGSTPKPPTEIAANQQLSECPGAKFKKVYIVVDFGSTMTKAAYMVIRERDVNQEPKALRDLKLDGLSLRDFSIVEWGNSMRECPTQLAYIPGTYNSTNIPPLWGIQISEGLTSNKIHRCDVLDYLKPAIYQARQADKSNRDRTIQKLQKLGICQESDLEAESDIEVEHENLIVKLWTMFQRLTWIYILTYIKKAHTSQFDWQPDAYGFQPDGKAMHFGQCQVEVGITVPAGASARHVQRSLNIAREVGMPKVFPLSEPFSAAACMLQNDYEKSKHKVDTRPTLIVDLGGATADLTMTSLIDSKPGSTFSSEAAFTRNMKEETEGVMDWCGLGTANIRLRKFVADHMQPPGQNVTATQKSSQTKIDQFIDMAEQEFERKKSSFSTKIIADSSPTVLELPHIPDLYINNGLDKVDSLSINMRLQLSPETMRGFFDPILTDLIKLIDIQLQNFRKRNITKNNGLKTHVAKIVLVGGGGQNEYLYERLKNRYEHQEQCRSAGDWSCGYPIEVTNKLEFTKSSCATVIGALVLLLDKSLIRQRILRQCYGFKRHTVAGKTVPLRTNRVVDCRIDGGRWFLDSFEPLIYIGDIIGENFQESLKDGGWRVLYLHEERDGGWSIEETLYCTANPRSSQKGLWVHDPEHQIEEVGRVLFKLKRKDLVHVDLQVDKQGRKFYRIEYAVGIEIKGFDMKYYLEIPRTSSFETCNSDNDVIVKEGSLYIGGSFWHYQNAGNFQFRVAGKSNAM